MRNILEYPVDVNEAIQVLERLIERDHMEDIQQMRCGDMTAFVLAWVITRLKNPQILIDEKSVLGYTGALMK